MTTPREADPKDQAPRPPEAANSDRTVGNRGREVLRCGGAGESDEFQRAGDEVTSLGGGLFSVRTSPGTGEPFPRSSSSFIRTRWLHLIDVFLVVVIVAAPYCYFIILLQLEWW